MIVDISGKKASPQTVDGRILVQQYLPNFVGNWDSSVTDFCT